MHYAELNIYCEQGGGGGRGGNASIMIPTALFIFVSYKSKACGTGRQFGKTGRGVNERERERINNYKLKAVSEGWVKKG